MADTTFTSGTVVTKEWLNDVNNTVYRFTQNGTGAVIREAQDKLKEFVSVKDFGAVGDGIVDDTVAIQTALDSNSYAYVYLPPGTYRDWETDRKSTRLNSSHRL